MLASHYAEAVERQVTAEAAVHSAPSEDAEVICRVAPGEPFAVGEDCVGWAWGYAGAERRVGYVRSELLS